MWKIVYENHTVSTKKARSYIFLRHVVLQIFCLLLLLKPLESDCRLSTLPLSNRLNKEVTQSKDNCKKKKLFSP